VYYSFYFYLEVRQICPPFVRKKVLVLILATPRSGQIHPEAATLRCSFAFFFFLHGPMFVDHISKGFIASFPPLFIFEYCRVESFLPHHQTHLDEPKKKSTNVCTAFYCNLILLGLRERQRTPAVGSSSLGWLALPHFNPFLPPK